MQLNLRFSDLEIVKILKENLVIVADSREKKNQHILEYFDEHKIKYEIETMDAGDYSVKLIARPELGIMKDCYLPVMIEKKNSVDELACSIKNRVCFSGEFLRANKDNTKVYLLVEQGNGYEDITTNNYTSQYNPEALLGSLKSFEVRFNFTTMFLDKKLSGHWIYKTLYYYLREYLKN